MSGRSAVVLVDKRPGPTSHDLVSDARRALDTRRVGHTGTLDPFAGGLLILCVGVATRLVEYFHLLPKTYEAHVVFGEARDTDDRTGTVIRRQPVGPDLDAERLEASLAASRGRSRQRPPDFSARRTDGRRAYEAARRGEPVTLEARMIEVREARLLDWTPPVARVSYTVSTGTYIRALARDLGEAVGCPAHLGELRRVSIGPFDAARAAPVDDVAWDGPATLRPFRALCWLPARALTGEERGAIAHGRAIDHGAVEAPATPVAGLATGELPVALHAEDRLIAIARRAGGELRPAKVFDAA